MSRSQKIAWWMSLVGLVAAIAAGLTLVISGPGYRLGWWGLFTGFDLLRYGLFAGLAAISLCIMALLVSWFAEERRGRVYALGGMIISLLVAYVPYHWMTMAQDAPPIHDIATDPDSPLEFLVLVGERQEGENPIAHGGVEVAQMQRGAYPDIKPLVTTKAPDEVFTVVTEAVADSNWHIAAIDSASMRIEATAQTFWFGFKDDVVVQVTPLEAGSRVDMRSQSRIGLSDVGTNAQRVSLFLQGLEERLRD